MTPSNHDSQSPSGASLGIEAAHWLLRFQNDHADPQDPLCDSAVRNEAFLDWLALSPRHVRAFLEIYETDRRLPSSHRRPYLDIDDLLQRQNADVIRIYGSPQHDPPQIAPDLDAEWRLDRYLPRLRLSLWLPLAAAAALVLFFAGWPLLSFKEAPAAPISYRTQVGERKIVPLADGSRLILNTASQIDVTLDRKHRRINLIAGEVLITVNPDSTRPFEVISGDVTLRDRGTVFDVYRRPAGVRVLVVEGSVSVDVHPARPDAETSASQRVSAPPPVRLAAGDQAEVSTESVPITVNQERLTPEQMEQATAWKAGQLSFRGELLSTVVAEFNRYNTRKIVIADPRIANYRVGGDFAFPDIGKFVDVLHATWGIEVLPPDSPGSTSTIIRLGLGSNLIPSGQH